MDNDDLTKRYELIKQHNEIVAEIYRDRRIYELTFDEIAYYRHLDVLEVRRFYAIALEILRKPSEAWMHGLSKHAKRCLSKTNYNCFSDLRCALNSGTVDLEDVSGLGHKTAMEIRRWCANRCKNIP